MLISDWSSDVCSSDLCKDEFADTPLGAKTAYVVIEGQEYCAGDIVGQHTGGDGIGHGAGVGYAGIGKQEVDGPLIMILQAECMVIVFLQLGIEIGRASCRDRECRYV